MTASTPSVVHASRLPDSHVRRVPRARGLQAKDVMISALPGLARQATLTQVSQALLVHDMGAVLVLDDDGSMAGIVTDGDLFRRRCCDDHSFLECCMEHADHEESQEPCRCAIQSGRIAAETIMSQPVISVDESADLSTVVALLVRHGVRRIPVTRQGMPVGMLGRRNVLRALIGELKFKE